MAARRTARSPLQDALQHLGARRIEAALIAALVESPLGTKQIVEKTGLRQPEVSIGMNLLRERGWVETESIPRQGKGRPMHRYRLSVGAPDVRRHFEAKGKAAIDDVNQAIRAIKTRLG
jgi:predicted transcriptional regulator